LYDGSLVHVLFKYTNCILKVYLNGGIWQIKIGH